MQIDLNNEEVKFIDEVMSSSIEECSSRMKTFDKDAKQEEVTAVWVYRSMALHIHEKMQKALAG